MKIVTKEEYLEYTNRGEDTLPSNFDFMLTVANEMVSQVVKNVYELKQAFYQDIYDQAIIKAVSMQVDFWSHMGTSVFDSAVQSYSFGNVSVTNDGNGAGNELCVFSRRLLSSVGLLYKGVIK